LAALAMEILWAGVLARSGADSNVRDAVVAVLLLHAVYLISVYFSLKTQWVPPYWLVLVAAGAFRLTAVAMPAFLTDDLQRYRWEGRVQSEGRNPYATRPAETGDREVPGRDFPSVYGPLTQFAQRTAFEASGGKLWAMKLPAILGDLAIVGLLAWFLPGRLSIYAWSPMPILEFWGQGHNDGLALAFVTAALLLPGAGVWLGLAAAAKWWPLVLLPALARGWRDWAWALAIPAAMMIPFAGGVTLDHVRFSTGFLGGWRNTDLGYGLLLALTSDQYRAKYLAFGLLAAVAFGVRRMPWTRGRKGLAVVLAMLAVSSNVHPWYLTWTLPFLALDPIPWVFLWGALMPLAYETAIRWRIVGAWEQSPEIRWMIYAPVAAMALLSLWLHRAQPADGNDGRDRVG
jgi:hypothetical protein